jgi:cysteinyl-tRNA synthetase
MVPKIVVTNGDLDVHGMARYFEQVHRAESIDVVRFMRKFVDGTQVRDLQRLADHWTELASLDSERTAASGSKNSKESERIASKFSNIGVAVKDTRDPKTGEITSTWEVAR